MKMSKTLGRFCHQKKQQIFFCNYTIILGLYCVKTRGKHIRIVVMNNLLPRDVRMDFKYDLKGSTHKRRASETEKKKKSPTFKDLDFKGDFFEGIDAVF